MSKKRKSRNRRPASVAPAPPSREIDRAAESARPAASATATPALLVRFGLPLFVAFLVLYLVLFFTAPEPALHAAGSEAVPLRIDMLQWLWRVRLPELPRLWTHGDIANVGIVDRAFVLFAAGWVMLTAGALGWLLLEWTSLRRALTKLESIVFSLGVGLSALSLVVLGIGLLGMLQSLLVYGVLIFAIAAAVVATRLRRQRTTTTETLPQLPQRTTQWLRASALWLGAPLVLIIVGGALFPPREFDVREYHLQAPKEWFQAGRITFLPHNVYANMPLGPQILALPAMALAGGERPWWWGAMVGKLLLASYAPLTALALFAAGRRFFSEAAGVIAALVYISIPWIAHVSMEGYVDGALAFYLLLAVYAALVAGEAQNTSARWRYWLLAGFLAGSAISCKYPGALLVVVPLTAWVIASRLIAPRQPAPQNDTPSSTIWNRFDTKSIAAFLIAAAIAGGPWLAKNWALTGNPTYPLLYSVFGGATRTPDSDAQWRAAHAVPRNDYGERYSPRQIAQAIANITVRSQWLSPLVWPLAALALFVSLNRRNVLRLAGVLVFVLVAWFAFTHRIDRFWLPALPLAALLAGVGATWRGDAWWRRVLFALLFWGLVWNFMLIAGALAPPKLLVNYDALREDASLAPLAHTHLNQVVPAGSAVVLVGDAEPFDLAMPTHYNTCFDACVLEEWLRDKSTAEQLAELQRRNISHVLVNWSEIERYRSPGNYGYSDWPQPDVFRDLVRAGVLTKPVQVRNRVTGQVGEIYNVVPQNP